MNPTLEPSIEPGYARTDTRFKRRLWKLLDLQIIRSEIWNTILMSQLESMLGRSEDYFLLVSSSDEGAERKLSVEHNADHFLSDENLRRVNSYVSHIPLAVEFYKTYGSVELFSIDDSFDSGIYIESPDRWRELKEEVRLWIGDDEKPPKWFSSAIVIGNASGAAVYFLLMTKGDDLGSIYLLDHDGLVFRKLANSLTEWISIMAGTGDDLAFYLGLVVGGYYGSGWEPKVFHSQSGKVKLT